MFFWNGEFKVSLLSLVMPSKSYTYFEYITLIEELLAKGQTTGSNHSPDYIHYTQLNMKRMARHEKQDQPSETLAKLLSGISQPQRWILLTEAWCGDAAQIVPFIAKMAECNPMIRLELKLRDENLVLMDQFLTDGVSRSIPKLIIYEGSDGEETTGDIRDGNVLATWGPRPASLQALYKEWKEQKVPYEILAEDLHRWYAKDKNREMDREFCDLIQTIQLRKGFYNHLALTSDHPIGLEISHADGCHLYTTDGRVFLDMISGIAVSSLGHRHPAVVEAIQKQLDKHLHVMVYGEFIQRPQVEFVTLLAQQLPPELSRTYLVNSGTEANEAALKLAKKATGRTKFVAFRNSYHGDTHGSLSVTGRDVYRDPFLPLLPNIEFAEFNGEDVFEKIDSSTAGVILEPIQGEGGVIPAGKEWLGRVREVCSKNGALLIFDEIQTGFFRTGTLFAFQSLGVQPDILTLAKAMSGGMPMGAIVSSDEIMSVFRHDPPLNHVTTFGGHPLSAAAAHATLKTLLDSDFAAKVAEIAEISCHMLRGPGIVEVRGRGAMLGLQLESAELTQKVVEQCFEKGILLGWTLHSNSLIRIAPPLVIELEVLKKSYQVLVETVADVLKELS